MQIYTYIIYQHLCKVLPARPKPRWTTSHLFYEAMQHLDIGEWLGGHDTWANASSCQPLTKKLMSVPDKQYLMYPSTVSSLESSSAFAAVDQSDVER